MSAAITAKAAPSATAIEEMSWNGLEHLARTSKNRKILAAIVSAPNACRPDAPSHNISDNRIVAQIVARAVQNRWSDVLEAAIESGAMTGRDYATILNAPVHATEDVHAAILREVPALSSSLLAMFHRVTPYPVLRGIAGSMRIAVVEDTLRAIADDKADYEVDEDGEESSQFTAAVTIALSQDRLDLVAALIDTGCAGNLTIDRAQMVPRSTCELQAAVLRHLRSIRAGEVLALAA